MKVVKHSGSIVDFDRKKLRNSLLKSGADEATIAHILHVIEDSMYDGMSTRQIYTMAYKLLKKVASSHAARYNLRGALRQLGPAGFFFEKYIARLFSSENYQTHVNVFVQGHCVSHEIDILLYKNDTISMVECKFHNGPAATSDVKVPMYILSRFNDLKQTEVDVFGRRGLIKKCRIVTNNRFTSDAVTFANCMDLDLLSWDYPPHNSLKTKIDRGLYPVTCLTTLSMIEKEKLLILDVLLVSDLLLHEDALYTLELSMNRIKNVLKEVSELVNN